MGNVAVLIDAGYLFASSADILYGRRGARRADMILDHDELRLMLLELLTMRAPKDDLLRIYWYDAALSADQLTDQQRSMALQPDSKLRLGTLNAFNQQKGVDTLMVMDVIALSRNQAVTSFLVITGDDDLRPAIEMAQEFGVKVHLLGIASRRGRNQADRLIRECDTSTEWGAAEVRRFFAMTAEDGSLIPDLDDASRATLPAINGSAKSAVPSEHLTDAIEFAIANVTPVDFTTIVAQAGADQISLPAHVDRHLLRRYCLNLGRDATDEEKKEMRRRFVETLAVRASAQKTA